MINSRNIYALDIATAALCKSFIKGCAERNIDALITSTFRDHESQAVLYAQGRTTPGAKVTNAKPGQSWHQWRCAFDFVPLLNGKAQWDNKENFKICGEVAESLGLVWAGRWKSFPEMAHCQLDQDKTLADYQAEFPKGMA